MDRGLYTPFEGLDEFEDLESLTNHILESVKVKEIKIVLPSDFETRWIHDAETIVPVFNILVGNATFEYIRYRAIYILENVKTHIKIINQNSELSFQQKFDKYNKIRKGILHQTRYFEPMNLIHFMSAYQWKISYYVQDGLRPKEKTEDYPSSKIDLSNEHWNIVQNTFIIRRDLLNEIIYLLDIEIEEIRDNLAETKYAWKQENIYDIYELLLALLNSGFIEIEKGTQDTFTHDFLSFFEITDKRFPYYKEKILTRKNRSMFLPILEESLLKYYYKTKNKPIEKL